MCHASQGEVVTADGKTPRRALQGQLEDNRVRVVTRSAPEHAGEGPRNTAHKGEVVTFGTPRRGPGAPERPTRVRSSPLEHRQYRASLSHGTAATASGGQHP